MSELKHTCVASVVDGYRLRACGRGAKHEHKGKWYCKTHYPPEVERRRKERDERWAAESKARQERWKSEEQENAELRRRADCFDSLLEALQSVVASRDANNIGMVSSEAIDVARAAIAKATQV